MGNFMRRTLAFILGMVFMVVVLVGGIAGGAYWAFKNLTLGTFGVGEENSDIYSWTVEDLTSFVVDISKDPQSLTLNELSSYGFDIDKLLTDMGVDLETANKQDVQSLKSLSFGSLFKEKGLSEVNMGIVFLFLPKSDKTGKYPLFSESARGRLRQFNLGDLIYPEEDGSIGAIDVLRSMKLGSILSDTFVESFENGEYTYSSEDKGLNLVGNVELGLFAGAIEGKSTDIGYEIMEGYLTCLKDKSLREVLASFGATDDETYNTNLEMLSILGDVKIKDTFVWNEEMGWYELDTEKMLAIGTVGSVLGYSVCTMDENCPVHADVTMCDGELYEGDVVSSESGLMKAFLKNLVPLTVMDLMGIEVETLLEGMYFGEAFGYQKSYPSDACASDCAEEHEHITYEYCQPNCKGGHEGSHNFYFVDDNGFVGDMLNDLANHTFVEALNGQLNVGGIIDGTTIGDVMGYTFKNGEWYDKNNDLVGKTELIDKILYQLYGKKVSELSSVSFETLVDGIVLGEIMGYTKENGEWYDDGERVSAMYNILADIPLTDINRDGTVIQERLSDLYVGDLMGYTKKNNNWYKTSGNSQVALTSVEAVLAKISLGDIFNGTFDLKSQINTLKISDVISVEGNTILELIADSTIEELPAKINTLKVGEIMGYKQCSGSILSCDVHFGIGQTLTCMGNRNVWFDASNKKLTGIKLKLAKLTVQELADGGFDSIMDSIVLSDVVDDYTTGAFSIIDASGFTDVNGDGKVDQGDAPIKDLASIVASSAKVAPYGKLETAGILKFDDTVITKLDQFYALKGVSNWKNVKTVNDILNDLISNSLS